MGKTTKYTNKSTEIEITKNLLLILEDKPTLAPFPDNYNCQSKNLFIIRKQGPQYVAPVKHNLRQILFHNSYTESFFYLRIFISKFLPIYFNGITNESLQSRSTMWWFNVFTYRMHPALNYGLLTFF